MYTTVPVWCKYKVDLACLTRLPQLLGLFRTFCMENFKHWQELRVTAFPSLTMLLPAKQYPLENVVHVGLLLTQDQSLFIVPSALDGSTKLTATEVTAATEPLEILHLLQPGYMVLLPFLSLPQVLSHPGPL